MKYVIALVILIAIVAFILQRRGSTGSPGGHDDAVDRSRRQGDTNRDIGGSTGGGV